MPSADIQLVGLATLQKRLKALPLKVEKKIARKAVTKGAKPIVKDAKARVSVQYGSLRDSLGVKVKRYGATYVAVIGPRKKFRARKATVAAGGSTKKFARARPSLYAHLLEFGTAPHLIKAKSQGVLMFAGIATRVVQHPGITAKPFLGPALRGKGQAAIRAIATVLRTEIEKVRA